MHRPKLALALLFAAGMALGGCASTPRVLVLGVEGVPEKERPVWPAAPDVPRFMYAGTLVGEQNFARPDGEGPGTFVRVLHWIAGLVAGDAPPVVLQRPQAGIVDAAGRILVTDASRQAVFVFDATGGGLAVWEKAEGLTGFASPVAVAQWPEGPTLVTDAGLGIVARIDAAGTPLQSFGRGALKRPTGLAIDPAGGRVFVADTYDHTVKVFDRAGRQTATLGRRGEGLGEFNFPTHLAFRDGRLYVTDTLNGRVQVIDPATGAALRSIGSRGLHVGNLVRPKGIAVDAGGRVYVVESYHDHLLVYDADGRFLIGIGGGGAASGRFTLPGGVWTDARDRIFVADTFNGRVSVFQSLGTAAEEEP